MLVSRILSFVILVVCVAMAPWYIVAALLVVAISFFSWFWEAIVIGYILGAVYGFSGRGLYLFVFFPVSFTIVLFFEERLKNFFQRRNFVSRAIIVFSGALSVVVLWIIFEKALFLTK